jgi:hypothetical protein
MTATHDQHGHRNYLTPTERDAFLEAAKDTEVRELQLNLVDDSAGRKKRGDG